DLSGGGQRPHPGGGWSPHLLRVQPGAEGGIGPAHRQSVGCRGPRSAQWSSGGGAALRAERRNCPADSEESISRIERCGGEVWMTRPIVAIVGRPNVGKRTLFNRITGKRTAIVEGQPGVTRDRIYGDAHWLNTYFTVIDTGGIDWEEDEITRQVRQQALLAVEEADVIIFMVDGRS